MGPSGRARAPTYDTRRKPPILLTAVSEPRGSTASSKSHHRFEDFDSDSSKHDHRDGDSMMVDQTDKVQGNPDGGQKKKTKRQMDARPSAKKRDAKNNDLEKEDQPDRKEAQTSGKKPTAQAQDDGVAQRSGKKIKTDSQASPCNDEGDKPAVLETPVKANGDGLEQKKTIKKLSTQKSTDKLDNGGGGRSQDLGCMNESSSTESITSTKAARSSRAMPGTEQNHDQGSRASVSASSSVRCLAGQASFDYCAEEEMQEDMEAPKKKHQEVLKVASDVDNDQVDPPEDRESWASRAQRHWKEAIVKQEPKHLQVSPSPTSTNIPPPRAAASYNSSPSGDRSSFDAYNCGQNSVYGFTQPPHANNSSAESFGAKIAPSNRDTVTMSQAKNTPAKVVVTQSVQTEAPYPSAASLARNR
jgi:hypothetical protein